MLYKSYEQKIKKLTKTIEKIYKFRFLILSIIGVILALVTTYLSIKGAFIGQITLSKQTIVYGEEIDFGIKSIFSDVTYEFRAEGSDTWVVDAPITVGEHSIRAVSERSFGKKGYSKEVKFIIEPKETEIKVNESTIVYGTEPTATATLIYQDKVIEAGFIQSSINVGENDVKVDVDKVKVVNSDGVDVTACYTFIAPTKTINITKKTVKLTTGSDSKIYDATPLDSKTFEASILCYGDEFNLNFIASQINAGEIDNVAEYKILSKDGVDVTSNYKVDTTWGKLKVDKRAVTFKADDVSEVYDGNSHKSESASITGGELVVGHFAGDFVISGEMVDVGATTSATLLDMKIFEAGVDGDDDVTANYQISYQTGEINILQRTVKVNSVKSKVYDHTPLVTGDYSLSIDSENDFVLGQVLTLKSNDVIANDVDNVPLYVGDKIVYEVKDGEKDVTKNYIVDCSEVEFTIDKRPIVITAKSGYKIYDAEPFVYAECDYTPFDASSNIGLISNQKISVTVEGSVTDVMPDGNGGYLKTENKIVSYEIKPENDIHKTVTSSYFVTTVSGYIYVKPCPVTVEFTANKDYDDTDVIEKAEINYTIIRNDGVGFFKEHYLTFDYEKAVGATEVYNSPYNFNVSNLTVLNGTEAVGKNYDISCSGIGRLTIKAIPLLLKSESKTREYNREKLQASDPTVTGLLSKHNFKIEKYAYQLKVGETFASVDFSIKRQNNSTVDKRNYKITYDWGILKVTKRKIVLKIVTIRKDYDGYTAEILKTAKPYIAKGSFLVNDGYILSSLPYSVKGDDGKTYSETTMINAQKYTLTGSANATYGTWDGCPTELIGYTGYYDITVTGEVIVNRTTVSIKTQSDEKVVEYDSNGEPIPLMNAEWTVVDSKLEWNSANRTFNDANNTHITFALNGSQAEVGSSLNTVSRLYLGGQWYDVSAGQSTVVTENFIINITYGSLTVTED